MMPRRHPHKHYYAKTGVEVTDLFEAIPDWPASRLHEAHRQVLKLLSDGLWHDVREISRMVGCNEAAAGARARDLRKRQYGGLNVECRRFGKGIWRYRWVR